MKPLFSIVWGCLFFFFAKGFFFIFNFSLLYPYQNGNPSKHSKVYFDQTILPKHPTVIKILCFIKATIALIFSPVVHVSL